MAVSRPENVERLVSLLGEGGLRVPIHESWELASAGEALQALASSHTHGKLGISVA